MQRLPASALGKIFALAHSPASGEESEIHDQIRDTLDELASAFKDLRKAKVDAELTITEQDMISSGGGIRVRGTLRIQDCFYPAGIEFSADGPAFHWGAREITTANDATVDIFKDGEKVELGETSHDEVLDIDMSGTGALQVAITMQHALITTVRTSDGGKAMFARPAADDGNPRTLQAPKLNIRKPTQ